MSPFYPIRFADQLRQHLRGLRKKRGFTQAKLGQVLGVSQARIAEIEANPGLVNLDQLLQVFSALGVSLSLEEPETDPTNIDQAEPLTQTEVKADHVSSRSAEPLTVSAESGADALPPDRNKPSTLEQQKERNPDVDAHPASGRNFIIRPKKGAW